MGFFVDPHLHRINQMQKAVRTSARLHVESAASRGHRFRPAMITLTYRADAIQRPRDISVLLKHIRQYLARRNHILRCVWVMELTKSGNPHYHIVVWLPKGVTLPKPDKRGWWVHGSTRIEWCRKTAVGYITKYISKGCENSVSIPARSRIHGACGLDSVARCARRWWLLPCWVRELFPIIGDCPVRLRGGGWLHPPSGIFLESPFIVSLQNGRIYVKLRSEVNLDFHN